VRRMLDSTTASALKAAPTKGTSDQVSVSL
jgi:hypothetical protein